MTPVLLLTGPIGVGKSAVRHEADALLLEASVPHATVVLEEIAGCWPVPSEDPVQRVTHMYRNLAGLWSNYAARGAGRLLLEMLLEDPSELRRLAEAIPGAEIECGRDRRTCGWQVMSTAGCSVNDRESPCVTALTGTPGVRPRLTAALA